MSKFLNYYPISPGFYMATPSYGPGFYYHDMSNQKNYESYTIKEIFNMVHKGRVNKISSLLKKGKISPDLFDKDKSLLHHALDYNQFKIAEVLIKNGASLSSMDSKGRTPKDIINEKNDYSEDKYLEQLMKLLNSDQTNQSTLICAEQNDNLKEAEVTTVGCHDIECTIL